MPNIKPEHVEVASKEISLSAIVCRSQPSLVFKQGHYVAEYVDGLENKISQLISRSNELNNEVQLTIGSCILEKQERDQLKSQLLTAELQMGKMREALRRAVKLAGIANDWDLGTDGEVEIDDVWISCSDLEYEFGKALYTTPPTPMIERMVEVLNFWVGPQEMVLSGKLPMDKMIEQSKELLSQLTPLITKKDITP